VAENQISVIGYDIVLDSMFILPVNLDSSNFFKLRFLVRTQNLILGADDIPHLAVIDDKLIISYPSFNDILVYDLVSKTQEVFTSTSYSFPSKRNPPNDFGNNIVDVDSFELLKLWGKEVRFGPITYLEKLEKYVRFVKGEYQGEEQIHAPLFLEIFDRDFRKVAEFELAEKNQDLRPQYLNTPYGLMVRAKDQPKEDVMYFYYLNISQSK
jgi:hypothetical protein